MPSVPADTNLSLGKLMRAAKHDTVSNYTTEAELGNDCGNTTTSDADVKMSEFYISAVDSGLSGLLFSQTPFPLMAIIEYTVLL